MEDKVSILDLLRMAYRWIWLLVAVTILGGAIGYTYSYFAVKPKYVSSGNMYVSSVSAEYMEEQLNNLPLSVISASAMLAADYVEIIKYDRILKEVAAACQSDVTEREIAEMLDASMPTDESPLIKITVASEDPYVAYDVARAVLSVASKRLPEIAGVPSSVGIVEEARDPVYTKANPIVHGLVGCIAGFLLGVLPVLMIEFLDNRIKQTDDIVAKYNLPVIGVIPNIRDLKESKE